MAPVFFFRIIAQEMETAKVLAVVTPARPVWVIPPNLLANRDASAHCAVTPPRPHPRSPIGTLACVSNYLFLLVFFPLSSIENCVVTEITLSFLNICLITSFHNLSIALFRFYFHKNVIY